MARAGDDDTACGIRSCRTTAGVIPGFVSAVESSSISAQAPPRSENKNPASNKLSALWAAGAGGRHTPPFTAQKQSPEKGPETPRRRQRLARVLQLPLSAPLCCHSIPGRAVLGRGARAIPMGIYSTRPPALEALFPPTATPPPPRLGTDHAGKNKTKRPDGSIASIPPTAPAARPVLRVPEGRQLQVRRRVPVRPRRGRRAPAQPASHAWRPWRR